MYIFLFSPSSWFVFQKLLCCPFTTHSYNIPKPFQSTHFNYIYNMWRFKFMINFCVTLMLAFHVKQACSSLMVFIGTLQGIWYVFTFYLDNDIVPIQSNHGHCPDGGISTERSSHSIELTHQRTCNNFPIVTSEFCNPVWDYIKMHYSPSTHVSW